jgi:hypothetical protein
MHNLPLILLPIHSGATAQLWVCGSGEMADTQVLGTCVFGRAGSSPASRTQLLLFGLFLCKEMKK